jgi:hypothetical protein
MKRHFSPCIRLSVNGSRPGRGSAAAKTSLQRRGAIIIFAMLALLLASLMIAALMRMTVLSHQQMIRDEFRVQAGLLADAGCERALARLSEQVDWKGDAWKISDDDIASGFGADVLTTVENEPESNRKLVKVVAQYPVDHPSVVRVIRQRKTP